MAQGHAHATATGGAMDTVNYVELLKYGSQGLLLALVIVVLGTVLVHKDVSSRQARVLYVCLAFISFVYVVSLYADYKQDTREARMTIALNVVPSLEGLANGAKPVFSTQLTPETTNNRVEVASENGDSDVSIDVQHLADAYAQLKRDDQQQKTRVADLSAKNARQTRLVAVTLPKPADAQERVNQVLESTDPVAAARSICSLASTAQCGWAQLASGNTDAATQSFSRASRDTTLPKSQQDAAFNALKYTTFIEGKSNQGADSGTPPSSTGNPQLKLFDSTQNNVVHPMQLKTIDEAQLKVLEKTLYKKTDGAQH
jgi:hypothetical protein